VILAQGGPPTPLPKKIVVYLAFFAMDLSICVKKKKKKKKKKFNIKFKVQQLARHFAIEYFFSSTS
jgi:hypothetical protein